MQYQVNNLIFLSELLKAIKIIHIKQRAAYCITMCIATQKPLIGIDTGCQTLIYGEIYNNFSEIQRLQDMGPLYRGQVKILWDKK